MDMENDLLDRLCEDWGRERPELDTTAMAVVGRVLSLAGHLKTSAGAALKPFDLHYSDFDVLATLRRSGAPYLLTPTELMKSVLLTSGSMTAALVRLTDKGLVARAADPLDGRVKTVALTQSGRELIDEAAVVRFEEAQMAVQNLSVEDQRVLAQLLRKLSLDQSGNT